jgi:hypothetical protein
VWPLRPRPMREVLRIGRDRVERWVRRPQGLMLIGYQDMDLSSGHRNDALAEAVSALFKGDEPSTATSRHVDLVLESAWLPVILLDVGTTLWSTRQVEALLRHRLAQLYDERDDPVSEWAVQLDHRAGDLQGLGYALAPIVRDALANAAAAAGLQWASLQPAFAWGWQRLKAHRRWHRDDGGWWVWMEQDRALVARVQRGRVCAMNSSATQPRDALQLHQLIEVEASRWGRSPGQGSTVVAGWHAAFDDMHPAAASGSTSWVCVAATAAAAESFARPPLTASTAA